MNSMVPAASTVKGQIATSDEITFLRARVPLSKRIAFRDGAWTKEPAPLARHYDVTSRKVRGLDDLAHHVEQMAARGDTIAVHGALRPGIDPAGVLRRKTTFEPVAHRWVAVDLDKLDGFPADPAEAAAQARRLLPEAFRDAAAVWQASAGHALAPGKARLRLWFWCDRLVSLPEVRAWFDGCEAKPDAAIWRDVQAIYLGVQVEGAPDPIARRIGKLRGAAVVAVPEINAAAVAEVERGTTVREGVEADSPHAIVQALGLLPQRNAARIEAAGGRRVTWMGVAQDFGDRAVSEEITLAVLACWSFPDDEAERDLVEALTDAGVRDAADHARHVRHLGEGLRDTWEAGEPLGFDEIERMVSSAATSRTSPLGSKWTPVPGEAFGAVVDEDQVPQAVTSDPYRAHLDEVVFGSDAAADRTEAALVAAVSEDGLSVKGKARLQAQLDTIRGTGTAPRLSSYADFAKWVREGDSKPAKPQAPKYESRAAVRARPATAVRWLVEGLIAAESLFLLHGREKTGKSFLGTDIAYSLAYGMPWAGRAVKRTGVVYVCPEGPHGFRLRQDAWHNRQAAIGNPVEDGPIEIRTVVTDVFGSDEHLNEIAAQVRTFRDRHGIECGFVILDTFRAVAPGADEHHPRDVGVVTNRMARLRDLCGCAVGLVHHDGKDASKGAAGSTAFTANVDSVFATYRDGKGLGFRPELQRDTEDLRGFRFTIETHDAREIGGKMERAGVAIIGAVVAGDDEAEPVQARKGKAGDRLDLAVQDDEEGGLTPDEQAKRGTALDVLRDLTGRSDGKGVKRGDWLDEFNAARKAKDRKAVDLGRSAFGAMLLGMHGAGLIRLVGAGRGAVYHLDEGAETTG